MEGKNEADGRMDRRGGGRRKKKDARCISILTFRAVSIATGCLAIQAAMAD